MQKKKKWSSSNHAYTTYPEFPELSKQEYYSYKPFPKYEEYRPYDKQIQIINQFFTSKPILSLDQITKLLAKLDIPSLSKGLIKSIEIQKKPFKEGCYLFARCQGTKEEFFTILALEDIEVEKRSNEQFLVFIFEKIYQLINEAKRDRVKF